MHPYRRHDLNRRWISVVMASTVDFDSANVKHQNIKIDSVMINRFIYFTLISINMSIYFFKV